MIPQSFIDEVQTRTDIVEIISSYIPLKRAGRNFKTNCPFHGEKTPSFMVSPQKQIFHCFGCGEGGGVIQFLMLHDKMTFVEAVETLARRLGLDIPYQKTDKDKFRNVIFEVLNEASLFYHNNLLENKAAAPVLEYLAKRGIDLDTIKQFRIGYSWGKTTTMDYLRKKNYTLEILENASLVTSQGSSYRDLFRERIMFPIFDVRCRVLGFGARIWRNLEGAPKYIHSFESKVYSKREHLFGLNFSKDEIVKNEEAIIVEGYLDMIMPFIKGIKNIVASLGTALTLEQIRLLRRYTNNITLVYDSDKAGQMATMRALDLLLENDLKVKVLKLEGGFDPDSLVRQKGKDYLLNCLAHKTDFFDYKVGLLKTMHDIESIEGKTKVAQEIFSTISRLQSEIEKYEYIKKLSSCIKVKEEIIIAEFKKFFSKKQPIQNLKPPAFKLQEPLSITEKVLIKFMFSNKKAFPIMQKNLEETDFTHPLARKTFSYFFKHYEGSQDLCSPKVIATLQDKEISSFISKIILDEDITLDREAFKSSIIKLRQRRRQNLKNKLKTDIKNAEAAGDKDKLRVLINSFDKINSEDKNA
jgi:DNA primase